LFLIWRGKNEISPLLAPIWKYLFGYLWKNPLLPPLEKIVPTLMDAHVKMDAHDSLCAPGGAERQ